LRKFKEESFKLSILSKYLMFSV